MPATTSKASENAPVVSVWEALALTAGWKPQPTASNEPTELLVIGAGLARTGNTSLKAALERLGLKSYHMKNAVMIDTQIWYEHGLERLDGKPGKYPEIITTIAQQGYTATVDSPNNLYFEQLMEKYPNAKVILGIRPLGGGESYAVSVMNSIARLTPLLHRVPYKWSSTLQKFEVLHRWLFWEQHAPLDPHAQWYPKFQDLVELYDSWNQHVMDTVPPEKLLVFKPTDGWEPLCRHLSPLDVKIEQNCQQVLANQEPFPFKNDTVALQSVTTVLHWVAVLFENGPTFFLFGAIVWWMVVRTNNDIAKQRQEHLQQKRNATKQKQQASLSSSSSSTTTNGTSMKKKDI